MIVTGENNSSQWTKERLCREIAELETLLERANRQGDDVDARWARELFTDIIQRRKEMLNTLSVR